MGHEPTHHGQLISFEELQDLLRCELWVTKNEYYPVHPPTSFHDDYDNVEHDIDYGNDLLC